MTLAFLLTTLVMCLTPGTGVVYTLSVALADGRRAGVVAAAGCTLGIVPHVLATVTGAAALLHASPLAFRLLTYGGAAWLLYMAWSTLRDKDALPVPDAQEGSTAPRPALRVVRSAVLLNLLNPKLTIFFFAFLPQFVRDGDPHPAAHMLALSGVFMLMTFAVFAAYGLVAASVRRQIAARPRVMTWLRRVFAGSFVTLGAKLALAAR
ncbi:LysE family translocator [Actinacidiphila epipremni]|jgi:threonine/homoserine/homoserine lactone efflux protein|uniref:LysE family translocator n=1 Tax=Actinacidiphila epipremni TaxID=2053013 RepID=A0ABX0ZK82_9ACTN|nr:LysE family translocator [Actinacidiphila epipremni]NJP42068.1 LysE family translocator [Actinacidiphila epipremni]